MFNTCLLNNALPNVATLPTLVSTQNILRKVATLPVLVYTHNNAHPSDNATNTCLHSQRTIKSGNAANTFQLKKKALPQVAILLSLFILKQRNTKISNATNTGLHSKQRTTRTGNNVNTCLHSEQRTTTSHLFTLTNTHNQKWQRYQYLFTLTTTHYHMWHHRRHLFTLNNALRKVATLLTLVYTHNALPQVTTLPTLVYSKSHYQKWHAANTSLHSQ